MGARLQSDISTGKAGKKGAAVQVAGDDPDKPASHPNKLNISPGSQFQPVDFAAVASSRKGESLAKRGTRGAPPSMPGGPPLQGHLLAGPAVPPGYNIRGNSPERSAGRSTTESDRRKLSTAGS